MGKLLSRYLYSHLSLYALVLALNASLLLNLATIALASPVLPLWALIACAIVLVLLLPLTVGLFARELSSFALINPPEKLGTSMFFKKASLGVGYAFLLFVAFCTVCGAVGLVVSLTALPTLGIQSARDIIMLAAQVLAVLTIPIPVMLLVRYVLFRRREHPVVALSSYKGMVWPLLVFGSAIFFGAGWLLATFLPGALSGVELIVIQSVVTTIFGSVWLLYCTIVCVSCSSSDCEIKADLKLDIELLQRRSHKMANSAVACLLSAALAICMVSTDSIAYATEVAGEALEQAEAQEAQNQEQEIQEQGQEQEEELSDSVDDPQQDSEPIDEEEVQKHDISEPEADGTSNKEADADQTEEEADKQEPPEPVEPEDYYEVEEPEGIPVAIEDEATIYQIDETHFTTIIGGVDTAYIDEDGQIQEIDNTLEPYRDGSEIVYENASNAFTAQVPALMDGKTQGITIYTPDGWPIELIPLDGNFETSVAKESAIRFTEVREHVDYQYTLVGSLIKEDIILTEPVEPQEFKTLLNLPDGLSATLENGIISIRDTDNNEVMALAAPLMEDDAGKLSDEVELKLEQTSQGPVIAIEPNWDWVLSDERVYPIRIDPTVNIASSAVRVACVEQSWPDLVIGENGYAYVGFDDGVKSGTGDFNYGVGHGRCRIFVAINYDFTYIMSEARIDSATFWLYQRRAYSEGSTELQLYRITQSWNFDNLCWNTQPPGGATEFVDSQMAKSSPGWVGWDVRDVVVNWVAGAYAQHGFSLWAKNEGWAQAEIFDNRFDAHPPEFQIDWSIPDPVDENYSLNDTTVEVRPMVERSKSGLTVFDGAFSDGLATPRANVDWELKPSDKSGQAYASRSYKYPDSTDFEEKFPNSTKYRDKLSNWQSGMVVGLDKDKIYHFEATASLDGQLSNTAKSDTFLVYTVKATDTLPSVASYYGVPLKTIAKDNKVQDMLIVNGETLFVRNPKTSKAYSSKNLSTDQKKQIDSALIGRGLHCEYGFEPVNMNTGNFVLEAVDATIPETEGSFDLSRTYNSKAVASPSAFGRGWSFAWGDSLSKTEDGQYVYAATDGKVLFFEAQGDSFSCALNPDLELKVIKKKDKPDTYVIESRDGSAMAFNAWGLLESTTSPLGLKTTIKRNEEMQVESVSSPNGYSYSFEYGDFGLIKQAALPDGTTLKYAYDDDANLVSVTDQCGGVVTYTYDGAGLMKAWYDADGNLVCENTYDKDGRVTSQVDGNGGVSSLSYSEGQTQATDANGNTTVYTYDSLMRTTSITYPDGYVATKAYDGNSNLIEDDGWTYTYDERGNCTSKTSPDGISTTYSFDEKNRVVQTVYADGEVVANTYNDAGDLIEVASSTGARTSYTYDNMHRKTSEVDVDGVSLSYTYTGSQVASMTDALGNTASFSYDQMARNTSATDGAGNTTSITYDACGRIVAETDGAGATTSYALTKAGLVSAITDANGNTTSFGYDAMYNVTSMTDAAGNSSSITYDALKNALSISSATGAQLSYAYDARSNLISIVDANGNETVRTYDTHGNVTSVTYANGATQSIAYDATFFKPTSTTDVLGNEQTYVYDARGNLTSTTLPNGATIQYTINPGSQLAATTDARGTTTNYAYTTAGRVSEIDVSGRAASIVYDAAGNIASITNELGLVTSFSYDGAGRMLSMTDSEGRTTSYAYDGAGRLISETDGEGNTTTYTYDGLGNLISTTDANGNTTTYVYDVLAQLISQVDALGGTQSFSYDAGGNLISATDERGNTTSYTYDLVGNRLSETDAAASTWSYTYDAIGNVVGTTLPTREVETATYDAAGNMLTLTDAAGLSFEMTYDELGNLTSITDSYGAHETYTYDEVGNVIAETDSLDRQASYTYNVWGQLTEETGLDGATTSYEYDAAGNLLSTTDALGAKTSYTYDGSNNVLSVTDALGATTLYEYDKANRLTKETNALDASITYGYDPAGNIVGLTDEDGYEWAYAFDALNRLVQETNPLGNATALTYDATSNITSITRPEGDVSSYTYDVLGRLISTTDGTGATWLASYDAYSNVVTSTDPMGATTTNTYDLHGALLSSTDALGNATTYTVDAHGNTTSFTRANDSSYTYAYDVADRLTSLETPLGYIRSLEYDAAGNVVKESDNLGRLQTYTSDALHNLTQVTDAKGGATTYTYDLLSQLTSTTDALGNKTSVTYDPLGRITAIQDAKSGNTSIQYDNRGNILRQITPEGRFTTYSYDGVGNAIAASDGLGNTYNYSYDKNSRLTEVADPLEHVQAKLVYDATDNITSVTDALGHATSYTYDGLGNTTSITDASGRTTTYTYDVLGQLTKAELPSGAASTYTYDVVGNLTSVTDALGHTTSYAYDAEDNPISKTSPAGAIEQIEYDLASRVSTITDAAGNATHYSYDELNEVVEKSYAGPTTDEPVLYTYDALSQMTGRADATGKATRTYDELGRTIEEADGTGNTLSYEYDADGNLSKVSYPDGEVASYAYDEAGNLTEVKASDGTYTYEYDAASNPIKLTRPDGSTTTYAYDDANQITKLVNTDAAGKTISSYAYTYDEVGDIVKEEIQETDTQGKLTKAKRIYTYDDDSRLVSFTEEGDAGRLSRAYEYDDVGNRTREIREDDTGKDIITYAYNDDDMLTEAKSTVGGTTTYAYDDAGKLTSKQVDGQEEITYEYGVEERLVAVKEGGRLVMAATYDGDANRVFQMSRHRTITVDPETKSLPKTADTPTLITFAIAMGAVSALGLGSPAAVASGANAVAALFFPLGPTDSSFPVSDKDVKTYANSALRNGWGTIPLSRIHVETDFESIAYVNSSLGEVTQVFAQSSSYTGASNHLYGLTRLASINSGTSTYHLLDGRGSTTAAIQGTSVTANYSWGAYGELLRGTYTESPFYGYDSEDYSPATGTLYLRARYLNMAEGSFGVEDSYLGDTFTPQSLNLYAYAYGNPVSYVDPTGHWGQWFSNVVSGVKSFASNVVSSVKSFATSVYNTARSVATSAYNAVKTAYNSVKSWATSTVSSFTNSYRATTVRAVSTYTSSQQYYSSSGGSYSYNPVSVAQAGIYSLFTPVAANALNFTVGFAQKIYESCCVGKQYLKDHAEEAKTIAHTALDVVSMVPLVGTVASGINAVWYAAEGDYANAGLSAVSMIPGVGTAVKGGTLAVKATATAVKVAPKAAKAVSGLVKAAPKAISAVSQTVSNTASALVVGGKKAVNAAKSASSSVNKATQPVKKTTGTTQKATSGKATSTASSPSDSIPSATSVAKKAASKKPNLKENATQGANGTASIAVKKKTYQVYRKINNDTGEVYVGRTGGYGSPEGNVLHRDARHHMNGEGFGPAELLESSESYEAIRGREQQLIDYYGGAKSEGGSSGNKIRGIAKNNKRLKEYLDAANDEFGVLDGE